MANGRLSTVVVGGGIGGLGAALALARAGRASHVLERSHEFAEIGAGLQIGPNATLALDRWGVLERIVEAGVELRQIVLHDAVSGARLTALDTGAAFRARYGYPYYVLHRGDLLETLLSACKESGAVTFETGRDVVSVDQHDGGVLVHCAGGEVYEAEALVAADGLWSTLRSVVSGDAPVCSGYVAYRGTTPSAAHDTEMPEDVEWIWIGPGMHFVQYRISSGATVNRVGVFQSARYAEGLEDWGTPEELDERAGRVCDGARTVIAALGRDRRWAMYDRLPVDNWTEGRVTLLGDAAHPMLQYLAQGACQALEDGYVLGLSFARHPDDPVAAFSLYQSRRIPRSARVQLAARAWGDLWHTERPLERALRDRVFSDRRDDDYRDSDWLYAHVEVL